MQRGISAVYNGNSDHNNPYNFVISEYIERMRLRKLGFTSSYDELDSTKSHIFLFIDTEIDRLNEVKRKREEAKQRLKSNSNRRR